MRSTNNYSYLIKKIDEFIRKYYLNQVIKGFLYLAASFFASFIIVTLAEYFGNFSPAVRTVLFYGFLLLNGYILYKWITIPLLQFYRLGKTISHEQASEIIGCYFSHIKDKLINTLQLKKLADENEQQKELIEASINQKIGELSPIPFTTAIKLKENRKYLKWVLPPLAIIILIGASAPSILTESTERILKHDKKFIKKAPFQFVIKNKSLSAVQGDDFELEVKLTGNEIPQDIYLKDGANTFKLEKENIVNFKYNFRNIQASKEVYLTAGEFSSQAYHIIVKKKPALLNFDVYLEYPFYLKKNNETLYNSGDLSVPAGTKVNWKIRTGNTSSLNITIGQKNLQLKSDKENTFMFSHRALKSTRFSIQPLNYEIASKEIITYNLNVIPDNSPSIKIMERPDSVNNRILYFLGQVSDDHGLSGLKFHYRIIGKNNSKNFQKSLSLNKNVLQSNFIHVWNVKDTGVKPGEQIVYYFEVFDNDGVNGPKSTRSELKTYRLPTEEETERKIESISKSVENKMDKAMKQAAEVERMAKNLNQDLLNKRELSFQEKKQVEQLIEKQKDLEKIMDEIREDNKQNALNREDLKGQNEQLLEKQKQIEDLFNNVLDEKTRELLKNIQRLLEENNKNASRQELSKMQMDNKTLQKELDRILELYKQLEFDQKLTNTINKLDKLAEKQEGLKEQTQQERQASPDLKNKQEEIKNDFKKIQQDLEELEQKNKELDTKNNFQNPEKEQEKIEDQLEKSTESLNDNNNRKSAMSQQEAAAQMKQLSQQLKQMQQENEESENQVNIQNVREILDNLLTSSFDQEKLMLSLRNVTQNDPDYVKLVQKQKAIQDNLKIVQDSLFSLSKKVPQIESVVNKEIQTINQNINDALNALGDRRIAEANKNQQYAMTSINNLALMLSEVQEALQNAMKNARPGGKGKQKSLSQLSQMQEQLNKNMQKARQQMQQQGATPGQQGQDKAQMSEQLAKMAREQQMIRQALQGINTELNKDGKGGLGNLDKLAKEMEQSETDLVNKRIKQETLIRQQQILTKLLDAEKAEQERELDNKRESTQGKDQTPDFKIVLEEFKKIKQNEVELLKTVPPTLNSFYKLKVGDYFRLLNSNQ